MPVNSHRECGLRCSATVCEDSGQQAMTSLNWYFPFLFFFGRLESCNSGSMLSSILIRSAMSLSALCRVARCPTRLYAQSGQNHSSITCMELVAPYQPVTPWEAAAARRQQLTDGIPCMLKNERSVRGCWFGHGCPMAVS